MHDEEKANEGGQNIDKQIQYYNGKGRPKESTGKEERKINRNQKARIRGEKTPKKTRRRRKIKKDKRRGKSRPRKILEVLTCE